MAQTSTRPAEPSLDGLFVVAAAPAAWYETGDGRRRWFDGRQWTDHYAPMLTLVPTPDAPVHTHHSTAHGFHLIMAIMTLGAWLPVWAVVTVCNVIRSAEPLHAR
jgi:hypothetical protein